MQMLKSIVLSAVMVCFMIVAINAQEPPPFAKDVSQGQSQNEGITTGCVITYGEILEPPYFVVYEDGKISINSITVVPKKKDPNREIPRIVPSEKSKKEHELNQAIGKRYEEYENKFGKEKAMEMVVDEFKNHEMIDDIRIAPHRIEFRYVGDKNYQRMNLSPTPSISQEEKEAQFKQRADGFKYSLDKGNMIVFGYDYTSTLQKRDADKVSNIINRIKIGEISVFTGKQEIEKFLRNEGISDDIVKNLQMNR